MNARAEIVRRSRPRGVYVPTQEAQLLLHSGWELLDDCPRLPGSKAQPDEVLLAPPAMERAG
jgi:hypothetical protein